VLGFAGSDGIVDSVLQGFGQVVKGLLQVLGQAVQPFERGWWLVAHGVALARRIASGVGYCFVPTAAVDICALRLTSRCAFIVARPLVMSGFEGFKSIPAFGKLFQELAGFDYSMDNAPLLDGYNFPIWAISSSFGTSALSHISIMASPRWRIG